MQLDAKKLFILAALGLAAFVLTRKASAATLPAGAAIPVGNIAQTNPLSSLIGGISSLFSGSSSGAAAVTALDTTSRQYYVDNADSFAVNPPTMYSDANSYDGTAPEVNTAADLAGWFG